MISSFTTTPSIDPLKIHIEFALDFNHSTSKVNPITAFARRNSSQKLSLEIINEYWKCR